MTKLDMSWDLSQMVDGASATEVKKKIEEKTKGFEKLVETYSKKIPDMSAAHIASMIEEFEEAIVETSNYMGYARLRYSADTTDKEARELNYTQNNASSRISSARTKLEIALGKELLKRKELLEAKELADVVHYFERLVRRAPYRLSEQEEALISEKDVSGIETLYQLQEAWVSQKTFEVEIEGKKKTISLPQMSSLRMDPDRSIREMATKKLYESYAHDKLLHSTALRGICADHVAISKRRGMPSAMTQSLLDQDVTEETVMALLDAIEGTASRFQEFLKLKAKFFGFDKLLGHDVIAPWTTEPTWTLEYPQAKEIVVDSFSSFDGEIGKVIQDMFEGKRIDAENRVGKPNTAFCAGWQKAKKSFILMSYSPTLGDLYTLAHENGHAAQGHMIYQTQRPINYRGSSCMAETGSIFGELLLTEKLLAKSEEDDQKLEVLSNVLNDFYYTTYYVATRALFEIELYKNIEQGELIDAELACNEWQAAKDRIFGDVVDWTEYMEWEWARIPHFFFPNYRFYNYSYSFAQMLVFAVYEDYKKGEADFNERFRKLLASGGSKSPAEQIEEFGYNLSDPGFWELGPRTADRLLADLKKLI
ncbi:MAG: hypothetical protein BAJATHORv1_70087 [Candidatus Thorarchaeota archaeon]|nr:MAG: hypothetical protein BAJATHORv1_70087 [Candidatus Thorarchaeota archaeon]